MTSVARTEAHDFFKVYVCVFAMNRSLTKHPPIPLDPLSLLLAGILSNYGLFSFIEAPSFSLSSFIEGTLTPTLYIDYAGFIRYSVRGCLPDNVCVFLNLIVFLQSLCDLNKMA